MEPSEHEVEPSSQAPEVDDGEAVRQLGKAEKDRLREMFSAHYDRVWRLLRRLGLDPASADDGAQQVYMVAARRLGDIDPEKERSFLLGTATRVASSMRQRTKRRGEEGLESEDISDRSRSEPPGTDELLQRKRMRELLDTILGQMEDDLRTALVLGEVEDMGKREVAECLGIPEGTAASRLRRARDDFNARLARHMAKEGR